MTLSGVALSSTPAHADLITYQALLTASQEAPPNASTGTGIGILVFDNVANTIKVDLSWINLTSNSVAAHIHGPAAPGTNGPVLFPFAGVPSATVGTIPEQTFAINAAQIGFLQSGILYFNIHTTLNPSGEIRGQILAAVPEPSPIMLSSVFGMMVLGGRLLRRLRRPR